MERSDRNVKSYKKVNQKARKIICNVDAELECIRKAKQGDYKARNLLLEAQLLGIYSIALKRNFWAYRGDATEMVDVIALNFDDIIQKFDETRGVRFFTHLLNWSRSYMGTELIADRPGVVVPANIFKAHKANEVARCVSGDTKLNEDEEDSITIFDTIGDPQVDIFADATDTEHKEMVERFMTELTDLEKSIIQKIYFSEVSMKEIGSTLHMGKDRVRAIRDRALAKMTERAKMELENTWDEKAAI